MSVNVLAYPRPVEEEIHGITVRDPYRWLEDRHLPETEQWITQQQERCESYFANCRNLDTIRLRVREYLDIEMIDQPAKVVGRYFYRRRDKGKEQASICVRDTTTGVERILVDPSGYGSFAAVAIHRISRDGWTLAYELRHGGTDKRSIHFVDTSDGRILSDRIEPGYPRGLTFTANGEGFLYCQELSTNANEHRVNLHLFHESVADQTVFRVARTRESRLVLTADDTHLGAIWVERQGA